MTAYITNSPLSLCLYDVTISWAPSYFVALVLTGMLAEILIYLKVLYSYFFCTCSTCLISLVPASYFSPWLLNSTHSSPVSLSQSLLTLEHCLSYNFTFICMIIWSIALSSHLTIIFMRVQFPSASAHTISWLHILWSGYRNKLSIQNLIEIRS